MGDRGREKPLNSQSEAFVLVSAESSSTQTRLLDHSTETPLSLAAAPLARHFYCRDPGPINQPAAGPSAWLLPAPALPSPTALPCFDNIRILRSCNGVRAWLQVQRCGCVEPRTCAAAIYTEKSHRCLYILEGHVHLSPPQTRPQRSLTH